MQSGASQFSSPVSRASDGLHLPEGASLLKRLGVAVKALRVLEKQPDDPVAAALLNAALDGHIYRRHAERLSTTGFGQTLLAERPTLQKGSVDLQALGQLPEGTVGRAFAEYFVQNKIEPFSTPYVIRNDVDYLIKWYRETHDLHHVLTGYATDAVGEMELQAFALGNMGFRVSVMILCFAALLRPHNLPPMWKYWGRLKSAYRRGKASENLFDVRYDQYLEAKVEALQQALRIPPPAPA
ncbi:MAG: Coq4 family protein [Archangium sp.]|nr:Coq4 family protein [Archangium sp.]